MTIFYPRGLSSFRGRRDHDIPHLAEHSDCDKAVHIEVDDFWQYIRKGYMHPWVEGSGGQNEIVNESVAASAECYAKGGYEVFVAGTVGPW